MTATYTFDIYCTLDGFGSYDEHGDWGGYWGKQGPEFLARRVAIYSRPQRLVLGATTFRGFEAMVGLSTGGDDLDPVNTLMRDTPATVVSSTLSGPRDWPDATVVAGDAVEVVRRLKEESDVPLRSHGSLSLNRALLAAGLVDAIDLTIFPVISGRSGTDPVLQGSVDLDLELVDSQVLDGHTQALTYRPSLHR